MSRVATAATSEADPGDELARQVAWRAEQLLRDTWEDGKSVWALAENLEVDYRAAIALRDRGCSVEHALRILT